MLKSFSPGLAAFLIVGTVILYPLFPVYAEDAATRSGDMPDKVNRNPLITRQKVEDRRIIFQQRMVDFRAKLASREATLRTRLLQFKDQEKAKIAQRVSENLNKINARHTEALSNHLDKMSTILDRVENSSQATANASASAQIAISRTAIATAQAAVDAQAQKDYTLNITTETNVRASAKASRDRLFADLRATRELVIKAKQSIANTIRVIASGKIDLRGLPKASSGSATP